MHFKRETSTSVSDLHLGHVSDRIKRLAIESVEGKPEMLSIKPPASNTPIVSVMSHARDDFNSRYDIIREIGKGGFSTVYQCRCRSTHLDYAVKVVDLRPLRLRERFNPSRLKREVDIMRRLHHPNIIRFVEVYEDADHLMMVMEYCPGSELFDVILARKYFKENDAKPLFAQIARALYYLHSLNIIHRDIKPENVLILNIPDPATGGLIAKLLDFGLSKNAGLGGSAAKTFVGTPCYLAPEVEYTSKGLGGTYGLSADCWSLGAVLYVMLVARFPEFEQDHTSGKIVVKLPLNLFLHISSDAKDLIRGLMNTNPAARLTMSEALLHPWLGIYRASEAELTAIAVANSDLSQHLQEEEEAEELEVEDDYRGEEDGEEQHTPPLTATVYHSQQVRQEYQQQQHHARRRQQQQQQQGPPRHIQQQQEMTAGGAIVYHQAMVLRTGKPAITNQLPSGLTTTAVVANIPDLLTNNVTVHPAAISNGNNGNNNNVNFGPEHLQLTPLLHLQKSIATCFEEAHQQYADYPDVASQVRKGALLCRQQLVESTKMLRKVEQTAKEVLNMFPDLELAIEEEEPQLAGEFFNIVRGWVVELREQVNSTQKLNKASMQQIQKVVEQSTHDLKEGEKDRKVQQKAAHHAKVAARNAANGNITIPINVIEGLLLKLNLSNNNTTKNAITDGGAAAAIDNYTVSNKIGIADSGGTIDNNQMDAVDSNITMANTIANSNLDANQVLELFLSLFSAVKTGGSGGGTGRPPSTRANKGGGATPGTTAAAALPDYEVDDTGDTNSNYSSNYSYSDDESHSNQSSNKSTKMPSLLSKVNQTLINNEDKDTKVDNKLDDAMLTTALVPLPTSNHSSNQNIEVDEELVSPHVSGQNLVVKLEGAGSGGEGAGHQQQVGHHQGKSRASRAALKLAEALNKLRQVDMILEQLAIFWANTEVILDMLTKKGQHVEQFIGFASKPRLMARFRERMEEYKRFWEGVRLMCANYIAGVQTTNHERPVMYGFLEKGQLAEKQVSQESGNSGGSGGGNLTGMDSFDSLNGNNFFNDTVGISGVGVSARSANSSGVKFSPLPSEGSGGGSVGGSFKKGAMDI